MAKSRNELNPMKAANKGYFDKRSAGKKTGSHAGLENPIEYRISMARPRTHYFDITLTLNEPGTGPVDFVLPVWAPGAYSIAEFEKNVVSFSASDARGFLPHAKVRKNAWRINSRGLPLEVKYAVYAFDRSSSRSYLDSDHAVLNLVNLLVYPEGHENDRQILRLSPSSYCRNVSTSLVRIRRDPPTFSAPDYDTLVDSPIMVGDLRIYAFRSEGKMHEVAIFGGESVDQANLVRKLKRIVEVASHVYGELPYEKYAFLIDVDGDVTDDGLEHRSSTYCLVPRFAFTTGPGTNRMFGLFCHEFFHLWNVKRMSPSSLVEIDYGRESYTKSLWISEGITTYYEHLLLRRARIYSVPEFLDNIVDLINRYLSTPGRHLQSAEEASYDTWVKFYKPSENSINSEISYYTVGALLGMAIDLQIRRNTGSGKNLDDVMRTVYRETYGKGCGFTDEEFQTTCEKIAGTGLDDFFGNYVRGTNDIPLDHYLGFAGLRLVPRSNGGSHGFAGIKLVQKAEVPVIDSVLSSTPAVEGGLFPGDEVIGVDESRVDKASLRFQVENSRAGKTLSFTVSRSGRLRDVTVRLGKRPTCQYRVQKKLMANDEQKLIFKNWLGQDWENRIDYEDLAVSPAVDWLFFKPDYF